MPQFSSVSRRGLLRLLPAVTAALLLGGCDGGGSGTAEFPKMGKPGPPPPPPKAPGKGGRVGSEQGYPS